MVRCLLASCVNDVWMLRLPGGGRHWARKLKLKKTWNILWSIPRCQKDFSQSKKNIPPSNQGDKEMWMFCGWPGALWEELSGDSRIFFNVFRHLLSRCFAVNSSSAARRFGCFVASLRHCRLRHVPPTQQPFITNWHKLGQPGVRKLKDFCSVYFAQRLGWRILMRKIGSDLEGQKRTAPDEDQIWMFPFHLHSFTSCISSQNELIPEESRDGAW